MSTSDKVTQRVLVRTDTLFLLDNAWLPLFVGLCIILFVAPFFMWSVIRVQVVTSFEYCKEAGRLSQS